MPPQRPRSPAAPRPPLAAWAAIRSILDGVPAQVCVLDMHGDIVVVNEAWRASARCRGGDASRVLEGASYLATCERAAISEGGHPADQTDARVVAQALRELLSGARDAFQMDYACAAPDHQLGWFRVHMRRGQAAAGLPAHVVVTHEAVHSPDPARVAQHPRESFLADLAASIPGAIFRLEQPAAGPWRFVYLSPGFEQLTGLASAAVCEDKHLFEQLVVAEDRVPLARALGAALARGEAWSQVFRVRSVASADDADSTGHGGLLRWLRAVARPASEPPPGEPRAWTGLISDITDARAIELALREREDNYRTLFDTVPQGLVYQDKQGRITAANPAAQRILGLSLEQLQGRSSIDPRWQAVREDGSPFPGEEHPAMVALRTGQPVTDVVMGVRVPDRGVVWILIGAIPVLRDGELQHVYATFEDITEQVRLRDELRRQASTDALTGMANRRSLMARLTEEVAHARRHPSRVFSVLAVDIDLFKQVNDNWGHGAGDAALVHLAGLMQRQTRPSDLVGRSGGEEFMVLLRDTSAPAATALAERLRRAIARSVLRHEGIRLRLSVSIGVAELQPQDSSIDTLLARADRALYAAKHAGRNRVCMSEA